MADSVSKLAETIATELAPRLLVVSPMFRVAIVVLLATSCFEESSGPTGPQVTSHVARKEIPLGRQLELDVLFVVDTSPAMAPHRPTLLANAQRFVDVLAAIPHGIPDLHLGVITSDVGSRGAEDDDDTATTHGDCSAVGDAGRLIAPPTVTGRFVTDSRRGDGVRELNYSGELSQVLAETFEAAGTDGCSFPRPFEAARRAIANPANAGFVREHATLAIVFLTPNDDCSFRQQTFLDGADAFSCVVDSAELVGVDEVAADLKSLKDDPTKIMVIGAFGPPEPFSPDLQTRTVAPSCTADQRSAQPGVRMAALFEQFPNRASAVSICDDDLSGAFVSVGELVKTTLGLPCFDPPPLDVDPNTPGDQYDCAAWLRETSGDERTLFACEDDEPGPCWTIEAEHVFCPGGHVLRFERYLPTTEPVTAVIECVVR